MTTMKYAAGIAIAALAGTAAAEPLDALLTFGFTDLEASYVRNGDTGQFRARSVTRTTGDVTIYNPSADTVVFGEGFADAPGGWDAELGMQISDITSNTANAVGMFRIQDGDGDKIRGVFRGTWTKLNTGGATALAFQGVFERVEVLADGDGIFEGIFGDDATDDNMFDLASLLDFNDLFGALVEVGFGPDSFFSETWDRTYATNVAATITQIPTPVAGLLAGVPGMLLVSRRRRG